MEIQAALRWRGADKSHSTHSSAVGHTVYQRRWNRKTQICQHSISDFIIALYLFRKCIMRSTGTNSLARRNVWIPPSSPCKFLKMLNWWARYSWARRPPGEWVCLLTPGTESCQTTVRPAYFYKLNVILFNDLQTRTECRSTYSHDQKCCPANFLFTPRSVTLSMFHVFRHIFSGLHWDWLHPSDLHCLRASIRMDHDQVSSFAAEPTGA